VAFTRTQRLAARPLPFVAYAGWRRPSCRCCGPGVPPPLRMPVLAYVVCLASMAAQAAVVWRSGAERGAVLALGGGLFMVV
jgi:hypothetical protein